MHAQSAPAAPDLRLSETTVNLSSLSGQRTMLAELLYVLENQTDFKFVYAENQLPTDRITVPAAAAPMPLSVLLREVTAQTSVEFIRRGNQIAVRAPSAGSAPSAPAPAAPPAETAATNDGAGTTRSDGVLQLEKFIVGGIIPKGSASDLESMRQKANVAMDYLGADQLAKYSAGDLSEAVFRIPGVSVVQGQYAVVRGLSDRFLSTTLQGLKLPSPDPEKQAVQLDLLPAVAVEAVVVSKTYQPSLWAESTGGNMDVFSRAIPAEGQLKVGVGLKFNSNVLDGGPGYHVRSLKDERFGFGSRSRPAPGVSDPTWEFIPQHRNDARIGNKFSLEYTHSFLLGDHELGVLVSGFNEASYKTRTGQKQRRNARAGRPASPALPAGPGRPATPASPGAPSDFETAEPFPTVAGTLWDYAESQSENVLGLSTVLGYRFSKQHELKFTGLFVQSGIDQSQVNETALAPDPNPKPVFSDYTFSGQELYSLFNTFEYFRERNLTALQLSGRHQLPALGALTMDWTAQHGATYQKENPFVEAFFASPLTDLDETYVILDGNDPPRPLDVVWADNQETQNAARLDFEWPVATWGEQQAVFQFGAAVDDTSREVASNALFYTAPALGARRGESVNGIYSAFVEASAPINFSTVTTAARETTAYYANVSVGLVPRLKLILGGRFEDFAMSSVGIGQWGIYRSTQFYDATTASGGYGLVLGTTAAGAPPFASREWYPGASLVFDVLDTVSLRLAYSQTSGRPSLREISPFFNKSIETGNLVIGNPALRPADVSNYDLRLEWKPSATDFYSVSVFRKNILNPIEKLLFDTRASAGFKTESWTNNPTEAALDGAEFEFRHNLGTWSESLRAFSFSGNFTWIDATVDEHPVVVANNTKFFQDPTKFPTSRRLFDQPEYIANLDFTWAYGPWGSSVTLAGYAISDVLAVAGVSDFAFDLYERAYTRFDLIYNQQLTSHLKLKFAVKNLTDPTRGSIYDRDTLSSLVERNTYHEGREFSLALTLDL